MLQPLIEHLKKQKLSYQIQYLKIGTTYQQEISWKEGISKITVLEEHIKVSPDGKRIAWLEERPFDIYCLKIVSEGKEQFEWKPAICQKYEHFWLFVHVLTWLDKNVLLFIFLGKRETYICAIPEFYPKYICFTGWNIAILEERVLYQSLADYDTGVVRVVLIPSLELLPTLRIEEVHKEGLVLDDFGTVIFYREDK